MTKSPRTRRTLAELAMLAGVAGAAGLAWRGAGALALMVLIAAWLLVRPVWAWRGPAAARTGLAPAAVVTAGGALAALLLAGLVRALFGGIAGPGLMFGRLLLAACLVVALVLALVWLSERLIRAAPAGAAAAGPALAALPRPAFVDGLPERVRGPLLALEMEDHYLRIHTVAGTGRLFMRLRDATAQLAPEQGALVHRSWWVARAAISGVTREGRQPLLTLVNGLEVPVSRDRLAALKDAGMLPDA